MHSNWRGCKDWEDCGMKLSTSSNEACKLYDAAVTQFVGWYDDPVMGGLDKTCADLLAADTDFVLGKTLVCGLQLIGTGKTIRLDSTFKKDIENLVSFAETHNITEHERMHVKAVNHWAQGSLVEAVEAWEAILVDQPLDIVALKMANDTCFYLGQSIMIRDSVARVLPRWKPTSPLYGYLHGMYAFGLEEMNMYPEAEKHALKGLECNRKDAWSTHALAHVLEMTGQADRGIKFMTETEADWSLAGMLAGHNYWHLALYYIENGNPEAALDVYDSHFEEKLRYGSMLDIVDASALLHRLELEGVKVGDRWKAVYHICTPHLDDHVLIFNDIHILMSCLGSKERDSTNAILSAMSGLSDSFSKNHQGPLAKDIGQAICQAFVEYDSCNYAKAVDLMYPIRYRIIEIGGSHAQRDLFSLLLINAALKSEECHHQKLARVLLTERKMLKENAPMTDRLMAKALACHVK